MIAIIHKIRLSLTVLIAVYFIYPLLWTSYLIGLWALVSVILLFVNIKSIQRRDILNTILLCSPFLLLILFVVIYPGDYSKLIERALSFVVFPICIYLGGLVLSSKEWRILVAAFLIGLLFLCIRGLIQYLFQPFQHVYTEHHDFIFRYRNEFNTNTGISPTYASMYLVFGFMMLLIDILRHNRNLIWGGMMLLLIVINLILLSAKMPMISLAIISVTLFTGGFLKVPIKRKSNKIILIVVVIAGAVGLLLFTRWNEVITSFNYSSINVKENSVGIRGMINQCNMELASKYFFTGVGPLNQQQELNRCYYQFEGDDFSRHTFNSHNQYFDYLLSYGLVGLFIILVVAITPLIIGFRRKDPMLISFALLTILCMLTENILSRQAGVVFYCFFFALLLNQHRKKENP